MKEFQAKENHMTIKDLRKVLESICQYRLRMLGIENF